ncbi:MAG: response regulator [Candidatus Marinimicrobia bacterium]|nr:response regulator [Candidatus Neomarinimicrobiota bacterium]MCF7850366.1 response regulator [Candidatus Neomarinimicrobiota bacterium]MCF7904491.1 response regulator [Candidatus Neomarinimicrobiota bacterium]
MEEFQKAYIRKLSPKVEALQAALEAVKSGDDEALVSAKRIAHILRGSGGTYGFSNISTLAAAVEDSSGAEIIDNLERLLNYLRFLKEEDKDGSATVLIVDDSEEIILIISTVLKKQGYQVEVAETAAEAKAALGKTRISLILLDLILPDADGRNFLIDLKADENTADIPVIVLSAKDSPQIKSECYALGAENYFEKPVDFSVLTTQIASSIQQSDRPNKQTAKDELDGMIKRDAFITASQKCLSTLKDSGDSCSLLAFSVDQFKSIQENYDPPVIEKVLKHIVKIVRSDLTEGALFSKIGEGEFIALLPGPSVEAALKSLQAILGDGQMSPLALDSEGKEIQLSFSGAVVDASDDLDMEGLIAQASQLMYTAIAGGPGQIIRAHEEARPHTITVLLAEDDELTAEFIKHRLERAGYQITHYEHGDEACQQALKTQYDLIITDVKMPGMDGFELVQRTRENAKNRTTPIIMLTSMGRENDIARGLKLGANDYMLKPFSPVELLARVQRLLK